MKIDIGIDEYLTTLTASGQLIAKHLHSSLGQAVPNCTQWSGRDLAIHLGGVYRWAAAIVRDAMIEPPDRDQRIALFTDPDPSDDTGILARLREGNVEVASALRNAPEDLRCWTTWPAERPRQFWIRRMVHETVVHLADAMNVGRGEDDVITAVDLDSDIAADGVDEKLLGFAQRYADNLRAATPLTIAWAATDAPGSWWVTMSDQAPVFGRGTPPSPANTTVRASAAELLLLLWGRRTHSGLEVSGNAAALDSWRNLAHL